MIFARTTFPGNGSRVESQLARTYQSGRIRRVAYHYLYFRVGNLAFENSAGESNHV
jgi:hypothetical protein